MNLNKENLNKVYHTLSSFVDAAGSNGHNDRVFMNAEKGKLTFSYTQGDIICRYTIPNSSDETFSYLLRLRCIGEAARFRGDVDMSIADNIITFTDGVSFIKERVCNGSSDGSILQLIRNEENTITVKAKEFWEMIKCIKDVQRTPACSKGKPQLWMKYDCNKLTATNQTGTMIAKKTIPVTGRRDIKWAKMLIKKYIDLIRHIKNYDTVTLYLHPNCLEIESDCIYICVPFQYGCIADYKIDFSKNAASCFSLSIADTLAQLDILSALKSTTLHCKNGTDHKIHFEVKNGKNTISCSSPLAEYSGDDFDFQVNFNNFYELMKAVDKYSILTFKYSSGDRGIIFSSKDNSFQGIIAIEK